MKLNAFKQKKNHYLFNILLKTRFKNLLISFSKNKFVQLNKHFFKTSRRFFDHTSLKGRLFIKH